MQIPAGAVLLEGDLAVPVRPVGAVVIAEVPGEHSGNRIVAAGLLDAGIAVLVIDLLTSEEAAQDTDMRRGRLDVPLLGDRLVAVIDRLRSDDALAGLPVGCFGAGTVAAAALIAAAKRRDRVAALVLRGGRPDLVADALYRVMAPTLLVVAGNDARLIELNRQAAVRLPNAPEIEIVRGGGPDAFERAAALARSWFVRHLAAVGEGER